MLDLGGVLLRDRLALELHRGRQLVAARHPVTLHDRELLDLFHTRQRRVGGIDAANAKLARVEQIKRFTIVEGDWLPGSDELTPTMKLKRKPIAEKYAAQIDAMYS